DRVILAGFQLDEHGISGNWPDDVEPGRNGFSDDWSRHQCRPRRICFRHFEDGEFGREFRTRLLQRDVAANDQQLQPAGIELWLEPRGGLHDDFWADPGRVAHGDCEMAKRHYNILSVVSVPRRRSRSRVGVPKAPDLEMTVTPSQLPPRMIERGRPGT